jgi:hypothetical protein
VPNDQLRDRYVTMLMDRFKETDYPSTTMMDRLESVIRDRETAVAYVEALLEHMEGEQYPSPPMLTRVNKLIDRLAATSQG